MKKLIIKQQKFKNPPPKDIMNCIHGVCFGYKDFDKKDLDGEPIRDKVYDCWNAIHNVIQKWIKEDEKSFLDYIKNNKPDLSRFI